MASNKLLQIEDAIKYGMMDIQLRTSLVGKNNRSVAISHRNMGFFYYEAKDYQHAIVFLLESLRIDVEENEANSDPRILAVVCQMIGTCYTNMGNTEKANMFFERGKEYEEKHEQGED